MIYVLHVMTGKELDVRDELRRVPYTAMVPREITLERKDGQVVGKERTLFASYVFVDMVMDLQAYYKIRSIQHVIKFLGGTSPAKLSGTEAKYIEWLANGGKPLQPSEIDKDGKIIFGPLVGNEAYVVKMDRRARRAKLRVTLAGASQEINLSVIDAQLTDTLPVAAAAPPDGGTDEGDNAPTEQ